MAKIEYFDYLKVARKKGISPARVKRLEREVKRDFAGDKMMYELHVLRALKTLPVAS